MNILHVLVNDLTFMQYYFCSLTLDLLQYYIITILFEKIKPHHELIRAKFDNN